MCVTATPFHSISFRFVSRSIDSGMPHLAGIILAPEYNMPTWAVATKFEVELVNLASGFAIRKG